MKRALPWLVCSLLARPVWAMPGLTNTASEGFLVLPAAQGLPPGAFALVTQLGYEQGNRFGKLGAGPLAVGVGLPPTLEMSFSMRENGLARDAVRAGGSMRLGLKVGLFEGGDLWPAVGLEAYVDHLGTGAVPGGRLLVSSSYAGSIKVGLAAGYHGRWRQKTGAGPEVGAAIAWQQLDYLEWVADVAVEGEDPWGVLCGLGARIQILPFASITTAISAGVAGPAGIRLFVGLDLRSDQPFEIEVAKAKPAEVEKKKKAFTTERPRFRLAVPPLRMPTEPGGYRPLAPESQSGPDANQATGSEP